MKKLNSLSLQNNHCPHPTYTLIPLCPSYWSFVTKDMIKLFQKNLNSRANRKQYVMSSHYRPRQCPFTLKINAQSSQGEARFSSPKSSAQTDLAVKNSKLGRGYFLVPFCYCANIRFYLSYKSPSIHLQFYPKLQMAKNEW